MRWVHVALLCVLSSVMPDLSRAGLLSSKIKKSQHTRIVNPTVHLPVEVLVCILSGIPFQQRCRFCLVSQTWRDAILNGPLPVRRGRIEELPKGEVRNFLLRRSIPILPTLEFDGNGQRYRLSPRETSFGLSVSEACPCGTLCIIHQRNFRRGSGTIGGSVTWWGVSPECEVVVMATGSLLFFFAVRSEVIHGRQNMLTQEGELSSDPLVFLQDAPFNLMRRYDAGFNIARGRILGALLYLVSALDAMLIINLAQFRS